MDFEFRIVSGGDLIKKGFIPLDLRTKGEEVLRNEVLWEREILERFCKKFPEYIGSGVFEKVKGMKRLAELLEFLKESDRVQLQAPVQVCLTEEEARGIELWELDCNDCIRLRLEAEDPLTEVLDDAPRMDRGGWARISIPTGFVYQTNLKKPKALAIISDGVGEIVASEDSLHHLKTIEPRIEGLPVYKNRRKDEPAPGVWQVAIDSFAPGAVMAPSMMVEHARLNHPSFEEGSQWEWLSSPVLPKSALDVRTKLMRSADPWYCNLIPGWIVRDEIRGDLKTISRKVKFNPIFIEGTDLHRHYAEVWQNLLALLKRESNVVLPGGA